MSKRNFIATFLIIASLGCLYPGLTQDMLSIYLGKELPLIGELEFYSATRSILGTIRNLYENDNAFVGFMILFFSVLVPLFKALALLAILISRKGRWRKALHHFVCLISKWSMADVFIVGVFLSFLALRANEDISAWLHGGFYWFVAYCILSILSGMVLEIEEGG